MPATILHNAPILTMDPDRPKAWAISISDGKIDYVWPNAVGLDLDAEVRQIDMRGRLVVPGFNDCHMHILPYGLDLSKADISPDAGVRDVPSLCKALRKWSDANSQSEWVLGSRYDQNTLPGAKH